MAQVEPFRRLRTSSQRVSPNHGPRLLNHSGSHRQDLWSRGRRNCTGIFVNLLRRNRKASSNSNRSSASRCVSIVDFLSPSSVSLPLLYSTQPSYPLILPYHLRSPVSYHNRLLHGGHSLLLYVRRTMLSQPPFVARVDRSRPRYGHGSGIAQENVEWQPIFVGGSQ